MPSGRKERTLTGKTLVQALNTSNKDYHFISSFKVQINPNIRKVVAYNYAWYFH